MGALDGRRILVTGAGEPLGAAALSAFRREGARADAFEPEGDDAAVERALRARAAGLGGLDVLAHLAGSVGGPVEAAAADDGTWEQAFRGPLQTLRALNQAALRVMSGEEGGSIVNLVHQAGEVGLPGHALIGAAAASASVWTRLAGRTWPAQGVRVNLVRANPMGDVEGGAVPLLVFLAGAGCRLSGQELSY